VKIYAIYISYVFPRDFSLTTFTSFMRYINNNTIHGCQKAEINAQSQRQVGIK